MTFWRLHAPDYDSDYEATYTNGSPAHPYGLPGVECDVCGQTWGGSRVLPYECPEQLRTHQRLKSEWAVPRPEHSALQQELMTALGMTGRPFDTLRPGDRLQPCFLDVPSLPRADFLWGGMGSVIVSQRIRDLLMEHCPADAGACPVQLGRIGSSEATLPPPIPSTGEPEDMIEEAPLLDNHAGVGPYYEMAIAGESGLPDGCELVSVCPGCGRQEIDQVNRLLRMTDRMRNGRQLFILATTLYPVVTDDLKRKIEAIGSTNVAFENLSWTEWTVRR
jgi:hypothetical protein